MYYQFNCHSTKENTHFQEVLVSQVCGERGVSQKVVWTGAFQLLPKIEGTAAERLWWESSHGKAASVVGTSATDSELELGAW